jgi:hypothetical protein
MKDRDPEVRRRAQVLVETLENRLDQLLVRYRKYGLPLPPSGSPLVRFGGGADDTMLGFLLHPASADKPATILWGTMQLEPAGVSIIAIDPRQPTAAAVKDCLTKITSEDEAIPLAVQLEALGLNKLAESVLHRLQEVPLPQDEGTIPAASASPKAALAKIAWSFWEQKWFDRATPRSQVYGRMKELLAGEPVLDNPEHRAWLQAIKESLVPSVHKAGTVEALIDGLVDLSGNSWYTGGIDEPDPHYRRLAELGFDAVPQLIDHLEDDRLTRCRWPGFGNFAPYPERIRHVVSELLMGLAGEHIPIEGMGLTQGYSLTKATAREWWQKASKVGEEAYLLAHVLPSDPEAKWSPGHVLGVIAKKYPGRLPEVYRRNLDSRPNIVGWPVAKALAAAPLPRAIKLDSFTYGAKQPRLDHRYPALEELSDLDQVRFANLLVQALNDLPRTPKEPYWMSTEAAFPHLVGKTDDARVWDALKAAARRADPCLRLELMQNTAYLVSEGIRRQRSLRLLATFLNDKDIREASANELYAVRDFPRIEIRNGVASELGRVLHLPSKPKPKWTPDQWEQFHDQVRKALAKEKIVKDIGPMPLEEAWKIFKSYQGKELRDLDKGQARKVLDALEEVIPDHFYESVLNYSPWYVWGFNRKGENAGYLVIDVNQSSPHPSADKIRIALLDAPRHVLAESEFSAGWRWYLERVELKSSTDEDYPLIVQSSDEGFKQYYAKIGNRFDLIRLEDSEHEAMRNYFSRRYGQSGPDLSEQTERDWQSDLLGQDRAKVLRARPTRLYLDPYHRWQGSTQIAGNSALGSRGCCQACGAGDGSGNRQAQTRHGP